MVDSTQSLKPVVLYLKDDEKRLKLGLLKKSHKSAEIVCAATPRKAIDFLKTNQAALLICSLKISKMDSLGFLRQAHQVSPYTNKILLNCNDEPELIVKAINLGKIWKCVTFPWEDEHLNQVIADGLEAWEEQKKSQQRPMVERADFFLQLEKQVTDLLNASEELDYLLKESAALLSRELNYDVVSIYLWDDSKKELAMRANIGMGLKPEGYVKLKSGEGLTGQIFLSKRPLIAMPASKHAFYKYFPQLGEENYESYIGVPILLGNKALGVLVAQIKKQRLFSSAEEILLQLISSRIASIVDLSSRVKKGKKTPGKRHSSRVFQGRGVSSGYAAGHVYLFQGLFREVSLESFRPLGPEEEIIRLKRSMDNLEMSQQQIIEELVEKNNLSTSEIKIFKTHLMIIQDPVLKKNISDRINLNKCTAEQAIVEEFEAVAGHFESQKSPYFQERSQDFRDIGEKLLELLLFSRGEIKKKKQPLKGAVIVAKEISPSMLPVLDEEKVAAIITETGGVTSHTSILAKSLGIPAVAGVENICALVKRGDNLLVDGRAGLIFANPEKSLVSEYARSHKKQSRLLSSIKKKGLNLEKSPFNVKINANVGFQADVDLAVKNKLRDIGLLRTEFMFLGFSKWPTISEQAKLYEELAKKFAGQITLRTLDIGADKMLPYFKFPREENPMLGMRSIRFSMEYLVFFKDQIKAVLMVVNKGCNFRILLPMISHLWELETTRDIMLQAAEELGTPEDKLPKLGIMTEVPAVLHQLEDFRPYIDFISIGTNDLVQYILAVDRNSSVVGHLYSEFHPAVIRVLHDLIRKSRELNLEVSVCGEIAGTPIGALMLMSIGCRNFSILPMGAPVLRYLISSLTISRLNTIQKKILASPRQNETIAYLKEALEEVAPQLLEME